MALTVYFQLLSLGLVFNADTCIGEVPPCGSDWFGSPCRYKCHCRNNNCGTNGECNGSSTCERGWFGPACQYVDLVATNTTNSTPAWVYDYPDTQCNTGQETVTVSLDSTFYFTWLRLQVNPKGTNSKEFKLQLISSNGNSTNCTKMQRAAVSNTVLDIYCDTGALFQQLKITGLGVRSLCAVYISGGRNVALGQDTSQTSVFSGMYSWKAVDGDRNPNHDHGSCIQTSIDDQKPTWKLTFQRPHKFTRYNLYNRDVYKERLRGFILAADGETGVVVFEYTDTTTINYDTYRVMSTKPETPVSSVKIVATNVIANNTILMLCEVELFGDVVCPARKYGRECEHDCHCAGAGENCFVSTGGCPSGCATGYQGESCSDSCSPTYYGVNCALRCSSNCKGQLCDTVNGKCQSCVTGKTGQLCDQKLPAQGPGPGTEESPPVAVIVGPVVAFVVLVTLIVIGVLIWRKRRYKDGPLQTSPHTHQNTAEINRIRTVTTMPDNAMTRQTKPSAIKRPNDNQDNTDQHYASIDYCNVAQRFNETPICSSDQNSSVAESRNKYCQEQFNGVPTSIMSTQAQALSTEYQNIYSNTNINSDNPYEISMDSTTLTARWLKSEDHMTYENDIRPNIYNSIVDNVPNVYDNDVYL